MRDSPRGETAASEPLNSPTTYERTRALTCTDPDPGAQLFHCSIIPPALYRKEKERERKEEGRKGRGSVQIALLLQLPSCAFQVL